MYYSTAQKCRICGNQNLTEVIGLGEQYLASSFVADNSKEELSKIRIPLALVLCDRSKNASACGLVQLKETVDRDLMYRSYFYRSGTNPMMREALQDIVKEISQKITLNPGDHVLDIGCNDGTMLSYFPTDTVRRGIDPAQNIDISGLDKSITIIKDYFSGPKVFNASGGAKFRSISSVAMFYDLDDPNAFVSEIKSVLAPDGVWCVQLSHLPTTLETLNFYDICHEHLLYYSLQVLENLMNRHDLYIFDASLNTVNGGSLRIFVTHKNNPRPISAALAEIYDKEKQMKLYDAETYREFSSKIDALKKTTLDFIKAEKEKGGMVIGLGASTKGNVLLQFFGIDKKMIPYLSERNPEKVGLKTLGTDIELVSEERARELKPSAMLVLIWFFKDELIKRERPYLDQGGKLFFPMPYPHIITKNGEEKLHSA